MARSPSRRFKRVYWDSCTWISLIQNETAVPLLGGAVENRAALARAVLADAQKGAAEIITSALSLAEVSKPSAGITDIDTPDKLADFFENDYIIVAMLDREIGERARRLMQARHPGLKPLDAVHVVSALVADVDEMHSFDATLLGLDKKLEKPDGSPLRICKPALGGPPLPLLDCPPEVLPDEDSETSEASSNEDDSDTAIMPNGHPRPAGGISGEAAKGVIPDMRADDVDAEQIPPTHPQTLKQVQDSKAPQT